MLVVDDERTIRKILTDFLTRKKYDVAVAEDGPDALEQLDTYRPDMVLLDIRMPGMDGIEALKEMKQRDPDLCVIMITAWGDEKNAREAISLGANDYITKPLSFEQLETHLSVHLLLADK